MYLFIGLVAGAVIPGIALRQSVPEPQRIGPSTDPSPSQE